MSDTPVVKSEEEWREQLTPEQYEVLRRAGTEAPFTGELVYNKESGSYRCAGCGAELFSSATKFESGTGWPSFTEPAVAEAVELRADNSLFMRRTEVLCRRCGGHLGHVFDDGPRRGGPAHPALLHQLRGARLRRRRRVLGALRGVRAGWGRPAVRWRRPRPGPPPVAFRA